MKWFLLALLTFFTLLSSVAQGRNRSIHVLGIFCNAYEGQGGAINDGVTADKFILNTIFTEYFSEQSWGVEISRSMIEGAEATRANVETQFAALAARVGLDDTVYIHFSGHGVIPDPTVGDQYLSFVDESMINRTTLAEQIEALPCKLKILITDCCSSYPPEFIVAEGDDPVKPWKNLYSLLLEHEGFVNITAASPGQVALGTAYGGFLTINLESDMQRF
ncbi:MAG: caspase family protein, partial [Verrucomicrobiota bacterium]